MSPQNEFIGLVSYKRVNIKYDNTIILVDVYIPK